MSPVSLKSMKARQRTFRRRHPLRREALFLGLAGLVYAASSAILAIAGNVPMAPVIIGMDVENYYAWQIVFILPLIFAVWILSSGVLLALGGKAVTTATSSSAPPGPGAGRSSWPGSPRSSRPASRPPAWASRNGWTSCRRRGRGRPCTWLSTPRPRPGPR